MELVLSEEGQKRLEILTFRKSEGLTSLSEDWRYAILKYIDESSTDEMDVEEHLGTIGKRLVRELFEEGYIKHID